MKKRILCMLLCTMLVLTMLAGCGNKSDNAKETVTKTDATKSEETEDIEQQEKEDNSSETEVTGDSVNIQEDSGDAAESNAEEQMAPEYSYTEMSVVMYVVKAVNVRDMPSVDGQKIGALKAAQEVTVTGQCKETSWYRIDYNGQVGYVSNNYIAAEKPAAEVSDIASTPEASGTPEAPEASQPIIEQSGLVSIGSLANINSLKKKCSDTEFQAAYAAAAQIVTPLIGLSREEQLYGIAAALRGMVDSGQVRYSTETSHYNDPYGYLVLGVASCAGCTRTTGLCLNMLGISYEHVNENQWIHQWCRVNINGTYWICDAYGLYVGPEPAPYKHPIIME